MVGSATMVSVGAGKSTFFAQTLKGTVEALSSSPARTAATTPSNLHLRGDVVILRGGWQSPRGPRELLGSRAGLCKRGSRERQQVGLGCFCSILGDLGLFGFTGFSPLAQVLRGDDHALPSTLRMLTGLYNMHEDADRYGNGAVRCDTFAMTSGGFHSPPIG